jgi:glutamate 5-kinase
MGKNTRKDIFSRVKRVVVKVGSGVLTGENGLNMSVIGHLTNDICQLKRKGVEVILVSSGSIASGLRKLGLQKRPSSISQQQALAAIGQSSLMKAYEEAFEHHDNKAAQVLLTRDDLTHRRRYLNARNTIFTLLSWSIVPVINENDTVVVDEIKFGDNDNLSAMVTNLTEADLLINLTNIDGLFDKDPRVQKDAKMIKVVNRIDRRITKLASTIPGFLGTGGMASKIKAAQKVSLAGIPTIIGNGLRPGILRLLFEGEEEGTLFMPKEVPLSCRKHWIAFTKSPKGEIIIDQGAEKAILNKGKSLLPAGIREVRGRFSMGDAALLTNEAGEKLAVGMVNYHSGDIRKIKGIKSSEIENTLGFKNDDDVIHRDNLILFSQMEEGGELCQ